jgi:hypothetical protein
MAAVSTALLSSIFFRCGFLDLIFPKVSKFPKCLKLKENSGNFDIFNMQKSMDGWILGGGDRAPARGPRFGLIVQKSKNALKERKINK